MKGSFCITFATLLAVIAHGFTVQSGRTLLLYSLIPSMLSSLQADQTRKLTESTSNTRSVRIYSVLEGSHCE